ncbi:MAG: FAD-dependent oxidoreductase [Pseudonocardia sp.]|nr:FAD-dependent oxidoreductase [Pseudonocardia sp.]
MGIRIDRLEFVSREDVDGGAVALHFRPRRPLDFRAGQHGLWHVPRGGITPFTIASAPEEELVTLATSLESGSRTKRALAALTPGSGVRLLGPLSGFTLDESAPAVVMLAQGLGITPFRSMLTHAGIAGVDVPATLVHVGTRHPYRGDTEVSAKQAFYPTSRTTFAEHVETVAGEQPDATFMVCGTRAFVSATTGLLGAHGIDRSRIRRDAFYGWSGHQA